MQNRFAIILLGVFVLSLAACQPMTIKPATNMSGQERTANLLEQLEDSELEVTGAQSTGLGLGAFDNNGNAVKALLNLLNEKDSQSEQQPVVQDLSDKLQSSGYVSMVHFRTKDTGARVKYQLITESHEHNVPELTNSDNPFPLGLGVYYVWVEREGTPTSPKEIYDILTKELIIELEEY